MRKAFVISEEAAREAAIKGRKEALQYCVRKYRQLARSTTAGNIADAEIYTDTCALCFIYLESGRKCPLTRRICDTASCHRTWYNLRVLRSCGLVVPFRRACRDFANIINRKLAPKDRI